MASRKRQNRRADEARPQWLRVALIGVGVVGTALVIGAFARSRTARNAGLIGLAHLAERHGDRIAEATSAFARRWWPRTVDAVASAIAKPAALIGR